MALLFGLFKNTRQQNDEKSVHNCGLDGLLGNNGNSIIPFFHKTYERSLQYMTLREFCDKYHYAESTVRHAFPKVQESILKTYGIHIVKEGRGSKAIFTEMEKTEEQQMADLYKFLDKNPMLREYFEGLED